MKHIKSINEHFIVNSKPFNRDDAHSNDIDPNSVDYYWNHPSYDKESLSVERFKEFLSKLYSNYNSNRLIDTQNAILNYKKKFPFIATDEPYKAIYFDFLNNFQKKVKK